MQLYLIRHAESENNAKPAYARVEDPPITALGKIQSEYLANWLKTFAIDALITSPFRRTLQTTRSVLDVAEQPLQIWHDVFERGGCFRGHGPDAIEGGAGLGRSEIMRLINHADCQIDESIQESGWWGSKNRETDDETVARAKQVLKRLTACFGSGNPVVAIITHADFKRCLLNEMIGDVVDLDCIGLLRNTGVTKLVYENARWKVRWLNSVTHLPAKLITGKET